MLSARAKQALGLALKDAAIANEIISAVAALTGGLVMRLWPDTEIELEATNGALSTTLKVYFEDEDGRIATWFNKVFTTKVSVSDTSTTGVATIGSTSLTVVNGIGTITVSSTGSPTAGYQTVGVGGAKTTGSATGLTNDATVFTASITVDGVIHSVAIVGSTAQLYSTLITRINSALAGSAIASVVGGNLRITSVATGSTSTVAITDTDLFSSLTSFTSIASAVAGLDVWVEDDTATIVVADIAMGDFTLTGGSIVITIIAADETD